MTFYTKSIFLTLFTLAAVYFFSNEILSSEPNLSPEIQNHSISQYGTYKSKAIAASCAQNVGSLVINRRRSTILMHGSADEFVSCTTTNGCPGFRQCGGPCVASGNCSGCTNGAVNPPRCNQCSNGSTWNGSRCVCNNNAGNAPACNSCPSGQIMQNNLCVCANGATNPSACNVCPVGSTMTNGQCVCNNGADVFQQCNACPSGQIYDNNGQCVNGCTTTNACGQSIQGYMRNGQCELVTGGGDPNATCIVDFRVTTNTVNPNGSVEFSWSLANLPSNIRSECGFVDLTTPTPRPIPGLQNLDPNTDRVRINNVQTTTRFCLVCQFYNLLNNNALLGEAVKHQWVRVLRVGEN